MQLTVVSITKGEDGFRVIAQCPYALRARTVIVDGVKAIAPDWDPAEAQTVTMQIPLEAIPDRMKCYDLKSPRQAFEALMREQAKALNALADGKERAPTGRNVTHVRRWGGLREDVTVTITDEARATLKAEGIGD